MTFHARLLGGLLTALLLGQDAAAREPVDARSPVEEDGARQATPQDGSSPRTPHPAWDSGHGPTSRAAQRSLEEGLAYLSRRQSENQDGSFALGEVRRENFAPLGVSALATLALMAAGNTPERGPYGPQVARAIDYLLRHADLAPEAKYPGYISTQGDELSRTHGHGFATLALAQAYGMTPRGGERLERAVRAAVELIERSQSSEGGWEYQPFKSAQHEGSVTICHLQALRSARNAGIQVDAEVIKRADEYVRRLQKDNGEFRYQLGNEDSTIALTAAAVSTLNMTGTYDDPAIKNAVDAIWKQLLLEQEAQSQGSRWPYYERFYLAQAFWQLSDTSHFSRWYAKERERVLRDQRGDGSWGGSKYGDVYATAVNCLFLALPEGVLPIFQR